MASAPSPCVYKSVNLAAGENFILPAGAELIYISDQTAVSSTNNCLSFNNLSGTCCWRFNWESTIGRNLSFSGIHFTTANISYYFAGVPPSQPGALPSRVLAAGGLSANGPIINVTGVTNDGFNLGFTEYNFNIIALCEFGRPELIVYDANEDCATCNWIYTIPARSADCASLPNGPDTGYHPASQWGL